MVCRYQGLGLGWQQQMLHGTPISLSICMSAPSQGHERGLLSVMWGQQKNWETAARWTAWHPRDMIHGARNPGTAGYAHAGMDRHSVHSTSSTFTQSSPVRSHAMWPIAVRYAEGGGGPPGGLLPYLWAYARAEAPGNTRRWIVNQAHGGPSADSTRWGAALIWSAR